MEAIDLKDEARECIRVRKDFRYFLDNYAWIEDKITLMAVPFKLWPSQVRILKHFLTAVLLIILKARQLGLTWLTAAYCLWLAITKPLQLVVVISAKEEWAIEFLDRCKFILERLPAWMIPQINSQTKTILEFVHVDQKGNPIFSTIKSLTTTPAGAQSKTPTLLVMDETARIENIKSIYASSKPGIDAAKARIILISNSIKDGVGWSWTRDIYQKSMQGVNDFVRIFMPWWDHPGRNKARFIEEQKRGDMDDDDISQHYPATESEAISTLLGSYFGKTLARHTHTLEGIKGRFIKNKFNEIEFKPDPKGIVEIWRYPYHLTKDWDGVFWEKRYAIGSDISEGLGQTDSLAYVIDRLEDEFVCRIKSNRIDAHQWATQLHAASQYYRSADRDALICPERTGAGITTCKRLLKLNANLYMKLIPGKVGDKPHPEIGWSETQSGKHDLCGDLKNWLRTMKGILYCGLLVEQCSTYIRHDTGKLDPEEGKYGDAVIAAGCTLQASFFLGGKPVAVPEPVTGWLAQWQQGTI